MRVRCPRPFEFTVAGPDGPYTLRFEPIDGWDGSFIVEGLRTPMTWSVLTIDRNEAGELIFAGGTDGSEDVWGDHYWCEARLEPKPSRITLWGDQVIVRVDHGV
jgi:hypothetical protein